LRKSVLLLASVTLAVLLAAGVALAAEISCPTGENGLCEGTEEGDSMRGTNAVDRIRALGGDDVLIGFRGKDRLNGGSDNDRYVFRTMADFPGAGPQSSGPIERITADESGIDTLDFRRLTQDARVWLYVSSFPSQSTGLYYYSQSGEYAELDWPNEDIIENFRGGSGNETVIGGYLGEGGASNVVRLGKGDDRFTVGGGYDRVYAGPGDDGSATPTSPSGGNGGRENDRLFGGTGDDEMHGYLGNDFVEGGPGADELMGGGERDTLNAADGEADVLIDCGGNTDRVFYDVGIDPEPVGCEGLNPQ